MPKEGEPFEIDSPEPDWLEPPRQCGHEWRNNDFTCMDCVEARITVMERELSLARSYMERIAELDGDCENQKFNLTRFQTAQLARRFLVSAGIREKDEAPIWGRGLADVIEVQKRINVTEPDGSPYYCDNYVATSDGVCRSDEQGYCNFCGQRIIA